MRKSFLIAILVGTLILPGALITNGVAFDILTEEDIKALSFHYYRGKLSGRGFNAQKVDNARESYLFNILAGIDYT